MVSRGFRGSLQRRLLGLQSLTLLVLTPAAVLSLVCPSFAQAVRAGAEQAATSSEPRQGLEEVIVTAEKKKENLQVVPVAVTALNTQAIEAARILNVEDLQGLIPGLYSVQGYYTATNPVITIRGIQSNVNNLVPQDSGIAMYVDGVYLGRPDAQLIDVADIQRIEVLRGPQATLYGRNSVGGAINVITQEPTGVFGARQDLSFGNYGEFRSKTRLDLPSFEGLSVEFSFLHDGNDGYEKNLTPGATWSTSGVNGGHTGVLTSQADLGSNDLNAFLVALKYAPPDIDDLTFAVKFDYSEDTTVSNGNQVLEVGKGGLSHYPPPYGTCAGVCSIGPIVVSGTPQFSLSNPFALPQDYTAGGVSFTTDYAVNDWLKLKNVAAYRWLEDPVFNDLGGSNYLLSPSGPTQGAPFAPFYTAADTLQRQISEEFDLTATSHYVDVTAGFFFFHENVEYPNHSYVNVAIPNYVLPPSPGTFQTGSNTNMAGYGQATVHLTDKLDLVAGLRESYDDKAYALAAIRGDSGESRHYHMDWLGEMTYRLTPDIMTYGKVSTGYISGGDFHGVAFKEETMTQAEVGAKADLLDKRLRTNLAWYWSDFRNFQAFSFVASQCAGQFSCLINYGAEQIYGGEAEITAIPTDDISLSANIGYTHTSYSPVPPGLAPAGLQLTPEWTLGLSGEYDFEQTILGGHASIQVDGNYVTNLHFLPPGSAFPLYPTLTLPSRWVFDARATLADVPVGPTTATISLWAKNMFDEHYFSFALAGTVAGAIQATAAPPATFGMDISVKY